MNKQSALTLGALALGLLSLNTRAELPLDFHVSGQATYMKVSASGEDFSPALFHLKGDVEFTDGILDGIGLQLVYGTPISNDSQGNLTLDITQQSAAYITLTNPETQPEDLKVSILLGYASTEIETQLSSLNNGKQNDTFSDFSWGFSLQDRVLQDKPFYWTLDCVRYYKDDNLSVDGCGLGVTYAF